ncbi:UMP kinase [Ectothiorhodospiraceae bacterium BW-2]|nr:UMP kinase [Ectothiorhodospiraceae bacterium BW-2]
MSPPPLIGRRILLKLSGEALMGSQGYGIDPAVLQRVSAEVAAVIRDGVEIALVIGGGNIFRGVGLAASGMNRVSADQMGMLATVINALAFADALKQQGIDARVMSALSMEQVCETYTQRRAIEHLQQGRAVIFAAGTGNPFFTTDSAATLRAIEIEADWVFKATKVDGVYDSDPVKNPEAKLYRQLTFDEVIANRLGVMDLTAMLLCREHTMPLKVFNMTREGGLTAILAGADEGTTVTA